MSLAVRGVLSIVSCASAYAALAIACGEDGSSSPRADGGPDALSRDSGADVAVALAAPCQPESTPRPAKQHSPAQRRSECATQELVREVIECAFGTSGIAVETCTTSRATPDWAPCERCIFGGPGGAPANPDAGADANSFYATPLIVEDGLARVDIGGCLEIAAGDGGGTRCAGDFRRSQDCLAAACVQCASGGSGAYDECRALADQSTCKALVAAACGLELVDAGCDVSNNFIETAVRYAQKFCR